MGRKRALIVDDSKSARHFLSRILEQYDIQSEHAESAEQAIEYLATHRPDVIFMDHLMPGMDGFQAVQAIKNNPLTATIPIMMYTSQEGELYLGQARALGAVGVLPKQIQPTDVSKVLYQLHLVPDRRSSEPSLLRPVEIAELEKTSDLAQPEEFRERAAPTAIDDVALRDELEDLRRSINSTLHSTLESHKERVIIDMRALLDEALVPPSRPSPARPPIEPRSFAWMAACAVFFAIALGSTALWLREANLRRTVELDLRRMIETRFAERQSELADEINAPPSAQLAAAPTASALTPAVMAPASASATAQLSPGGGTSASMASAATAGAVLPAVQEAAAPSVPQPIVELVPYGSDPLSGARHDRVRQLLNRLDVENFRGTVEIKTLPGQFCLVGNAVEGYSLAPDDMLYSNCDVVGNPHDDALPDAQRTPLQLANLIGDLRSSSQGALDVRVLTGSAADVAEPYPTVTEQLTAGEWNRAGRANNRIEILLR